MALTVQERRKGPSHHWSGPRLPASPREANPDELLSDPAKGERVARCLACGSPDDLHLFGLALRGKACGYIRLCGRCYYHANPIDPQAGDPLQAA